MTEIAIDTSAIVEILTRGPKTASLREKIEAANSAVTTPIARVEAAMVLIGRFGWDRFEFDRAWATLGLEEVPADSAIGTLAIDAFVSWGKGRHAAGLNFGDCFSHALATARSVPLLFVGNDFNRTEIEPA